MPAFVGRSAVVTHIGDGYRAAGFLPIAMPSSVRHSIDLVEPESPTFATGCMPAPSCDWLQTVPGFSIEIVWLGRRFGVDALWRGRARPDERMDGPLLASWALGALAADYILALAFVDEAVPSVGLMVSLRMRTRRRWILSHRPCSTLAPPTRARRWQTCTTRT